MKDGNQDAATGVADDCANGDPSTASVDFGGEDLKVEHQNRDLGETHDDFVEDLDDKEVLLNRSDCKRD